MGLRSSLKKALGGTVGGLLAAPISGPAAGIKSMLSGDSALEAIANDFAIQQGAVTGGMDALGLTGLANYGRKLTAAEQANLRGQARGAGMLLGGDSRGWNVMEQSGRNFGRNPYVAPIATAVGAYFLGPAISGALGGGVAGAAGSGAAIGAGSARAQGVEDSRGLMTAAGTGAVSGAAGQLGAQTGQSLAQSGYVTPQAGRIIGGGVGGAAGAGGSTAVRGGNSDEIIEAMERGALTGAATSAGNVYGGRAGGMLTKQAIQQYYARQAAEERAKLIQENQRARTMLSQRQVDPRMLAAYQQYLAQKRA